MTQPRPTIVFYHIADLDGKCSAEICRRAIAADHAAGTELIGIDYGAGDGDDFPWDKVAGRDVYMVDFSLQPFSDMIKLAKVTSRFTWIDHHKSAIDDFQIACDTTTGGEEAAALSAIHGKLEVGPAACELCWRHFYGGDDGDTPDHVYLLGRYDVWDIKAAPEVLPFQYGMRCVDNEPGAKQWDALFEVGKVSVDTVVERGEHILNYAKEQNAIIMRRSFPAKVDEFDVIAVNAAKLNSQAFDTVWDPKKYHAMCVFQMLPTGKWTISLYTDRPDVDVGTYCKSQGGGGHRQAAGFQCAFVPVLPKVQVR